MVLRGIFSRTYNSSKHQDESKDMKVSKDFKGSANIHRKAIRTQHSQSRMKGEDLHEHGDDSATTTMGRYLSTQISSEE